MGAGLSEATKERSSAVICLDGADVGISSGKSSKTVRSSPEVIEIPSDSSDDEGNDDVDINDNAAAAEPGVNPGGGAKKPAVSMLKFSVSKNSGRITIHETTTNASLGNFDVRQVVSNETADNLLGTSVQKQTTSNFSSSSRAPAVLMVHFNDPAIRRLQSEMTEKNETEFTAALKTFVTAWLKLGEREKKVFRDSDRAVSAESLGAAVARLLSDAAAATAAAAVTGVRGTTERYLGGAKERALERRKDDNATAADHDVLAGFACAWCSRHLSHASWKAGSAYCSQRCAEEGRLKRGGMYSSSQLRAMAFARDHGVCALCRRDCRALYEQILPLEPALRLNKLLSLNWRLPKSSKAMKNFVSNAPREGDFWQVDHVRAVSEGGGGCGLDNLRTLCVPCHADETEKLRRRLKLRGDDDDDYDDEGDKGKKRKQRRISEFVEVTTSSSKKR